MGNFKLPDIVPSSQTVDMGARAIEHAGAQLNQAAQEWTRFTTEFDKARILADAHTADLKARSALDGFYELQVKNPTLTKDEAAKVFGGALPPEVEDRFAKVQALPFYEIAPQAFLAVSKRAREEAAAGITGEGWQAKFLQARERDDAEALRGVMQSSLTQAKAYTTVALKNSVQENLNRRDYSAAWMSAEAIQDPTERAKAVTRLPYAIRDQELTTGLRPPGETPAERIGALSSRRAQVAANFFPIPLGEEEKAEWLGKYDNAIAIEQKAVYEGTLRGWDGPFQAGFHIQDPLKRRAYFNSLAPPPVGLKDEDFRVRNKALEDARAGAPQSDNLSLYAKLYENDRARLKGLSEAEAEALGGFFTPATTRHLIEERQRALSGGPPVVPEAVYKNFAFALGRLGFKSGKDANPRQQAQYDDAMGRLLLHYNNLPQGSRPADHRQALLMAAPLIKSDSDEAVKDLDAGLVAAIGGATGALSNRDIAERAAQYKAARDAVEQAWGEATVDQDFDDIAGVDVWARANSPQGKAEAVRQIRRAAEAAGRPLTADPTEQQIYEQVISNVYGSFASRKKLAERRAAKEQEAARKQVSAAAETEARFEKLSGESATRSQEFTDRVAEAFGLQTLPGDPAFREAAFAAYRASLNYAGEYGRMGTSRVERVKAEYADLLRETKELETGNLEAEYAAFLADWKRQYPPQNVLGVEMRNDPPGFEEWKARIKGAR